jgi:serine/threonine protein phosphatase 1
MGMPFPSAVIPRAAQTAVVPRWTVGLKAKSIHPSLTESYWRRNHIRRNQATLLQRVHESMFGSLFRRNARADQTVRHIQPSVGERTRVYAIGDVHGCSDLLIDTFRRVDADAARTPVANSVEVLIGDLIDRGPDSRGVIEAILARRLTRKVVCLAGNHEQLFTSAIADPANLPRWQQSGGATTLRSYGIDPVRRPDARTASAAVADLGKIIPSAHLDFLRWLPLLFEVGDYAFVHAGVRPGVSLADQDANDLLWIREEFLECNARFEKFVVHGHTPVAEPEFRPNRINIDTGAYMTGRLTCLVLEAAEWRLL